MHWGLSNEKVSAVKAEGDIQGLTLGNERVTNLQGRLKARMAMELEGYFEFLGPDDIRLKGSRVGIEFLLRDYQEGASLEEIALRYPTLSLEQVHATITYYLSHQERVDAYLARWRAQGQAAWEQQNRQPSEFVRDLRQRVEQQRRALQAAGKLSSPAPL